MSEDLTYENLNLFIYRPENRNSEEQLEKDINNMLSTTTNTFKESFIGNSKEYSEDIFKQDVTKQKKSKGRKKKDCKISGSHTKNSKDNILRKLKVHFQHYVITLVNNAIKEYYKGKQKFMFRNLSGKATSNVRIKDNEAFLKSDLRTLLKQDLSNRYKNKKNLNYQYIEKINKKNISFIEIILDMKYEECFTECFLKSNNILGPQYENVFKETNSFEECFKNEKAKDNKYYQKIKKYAGEFVNFFKSKHYKKK